MNAALCEGRGITARGARCAGALTTSLFFCYALAVKITSDRNSGPLPGIRHSSLVTANYFGSGLNDASNFAGGSVLSTSFFSSQPRRAVMTP
jgi:hypothetical protein